MTFQENLNRICKEQGTTLTALVKRMGLSTSKVSRWNEGALPKQEMLLRLAEELRGTSPVVGTNPTIHGCVVVHTIHREFKPHQWRKFTPEYY